MKTLFLALSIGLTPVIANAELLDVHGLWLTEAKDGHVKITDCGDGTPCGTLVWVAPATTPTDRDAQNPDAELQDRALIGIPIVWGYEAGRRAWGRGRIYNPEDGKTFRSSLRRLENGNLQVKGCLGPICITNIWTPVEVPLGQAGQT